MHYSEKIVERKRRVVSENVNSLTKKENQILEVLANGKTNLQIAQALFISDKTVKEHLWNIFQKLGADNRTHAVVIAFRKGLVT